MSRSFGALGLGLVLWASGCGGAAVSPLKPKQLVGPDEQYRTLEQAAAAFEHYASELEGPYAQNDLDGQADSEQYKRPAATPSAPSPSSAPRPSSMQPGMAPSTDAMADRAPSKASPEKEEAGGKQKDSCEMPCKAFASMKRAGEAICRLDTQGGPHCAQAKQRMAAATDRLASCACAS
jgi:hypothetical protein